MGGGRAATLPRGAGEPSNALGDPSEWRMKKRRRRKVTAVCRELRTARPVAV